MIVARTGLLAPVVDGALALVLGRRSVALLTCAVSIRMPLRLTWRRGSTRSLGVAATRARPSGRRCALAPRPQFLGGRPPTPPNLVLAAMAACAGGAR